MRKPAFCICQNKGTDQLRSKRAADKHLGFSYIESTIPLLPKSEIPKKKKKKKKLREKSTQTQRGRGNRQIQTSTNRTNVRKALRLALSSPSEVTAILKGLKNTK